MAPAAAAGMAALAVGADGQVHVVQAPVPVPQAGEVLVKVACGAVNSMDVGVPKGGWASRAKRWCRQGPTLTGIEFSGAAFSNRRRIRNGKRVIGYSRVLQVARTHCQFVAMPERDLQLIPHEISGTGTAALVVSGVTRLAIFEGIRRPQPGEHCLVIGAALRRMPATGKPALKQQEQHHACGSTRLFPSPLRPGGPPDKRRIRGQQGQMNQTIDFRDSMHCHACFA